MFAKVVLLSPPFSELTYSLPDFFPEGFWRCGMRVAVPLGGKSRIFLRAGYIREITAESGLSDSIRCKEIFWPLETIPLLNADLVALAADLCLRHGIEEGAIFGQALPNGLRSTAVRIKCSSGGNTENHRLSDLMKFPELRKKLAEDLQSGNAFILPPTEDGLERELCMLCADPPWPVRPSAKKQIQILEFLHTGRVVSKKELLRKLGSAAAKPLQALLKAGLVKIELDADPELPPEELLPPPEGTFELNDGQKRALDDLENALSEDKAQCRLLYGVTGSGKTAVYLRIADKCLASGKSVILLAPEIALAHKLYRDVQESLPHFPSILYHGSQLPRKREIIFRDIAGRTNPIILVGTRSALFLPVRNPGCVILDEEHDSSFKQDEKFAYHAKEVGWFRVQKTGGLLLFGSATPDVKTFFAGKCGKLPVLSLDGRVGNRPLPPMELVDIGSSHGGTAAGTLAASGEGKSILGEKCVDALRSCMEAGDQAVILLNRRGYSPMIYCLNCAKTLRCPHCEIGLAYHKNIGRLVCHYCGFSLPYPSPCPDCGRVNYLPIGEGTEKLAEKLEAIAGQPILRLDRDSARRPGRMEEILAAFGRGESPFLVGTQMLSKGHHFPRVTLVVVADGDIGLNLPDYRAAERTFQLLVQSAGRAGRGEKPGRVLVQTRDVTHYCWKYITNYDYEGFYAEELERRKKRLYPPFINLALLRISFPLEDEEGQNAMREVGDVLRNRAKELDVRVLGPTPAPIAILRGRKRFQCLFKSNEWRKIRQLYFYVTHLKSAGHLRMFLDLDPVNML